MDHPLDSAPEDTHFDLVVIGFGKAGKTLAMSRAKAGDRVALIEQDPGMYGGTCINIGCVPTKTLLSATSRGMDLRDAQGTRDKLVEAMNSANKKLADDAGVTVINAHARFTGEREVTLTAQDTAEGTDGSDASDGLTLTSDTVVINTGSVPVWPGIPGVDSPLVHDSTSVQHISPAPKRLVVVGGGPIGCEFATLFAAQGAEVTILDAAPTPLSKCDDDVAAEARTVLEGSGVRFESGASVTGFETSGAEVTVRYEKNDKNDTNDDDGDGGSGRNGVTSENDGTPAELTVDACLVAIGRRSATDGLELSAAGVEVGDRGEVKVDEYVRTSAAGVYAAGDVNGGPQFTYVSLDDFRVIADQLTSADAGSDSASTSGTATGARSTAGQIIPTTTFLTPPLSTIGMSEDEGRRSGRTIEVRSKKVADIPTMPRPKIVGHPEGYAKLIVDAETDEILGASLFCVDSQELINTVAVAMRHGVSATELGGGIYTHPSSSEVFNALLG